MNLTCTPSIWAGLVLGFLTASTIHAEQFGLFTYEVLEDEIVITDYPQDAVGEVEIPHKIDGKPVTSIGHGAFGRCRRLTGITLPDSVTTIGREAFYGCTGLTSIFIPAKVASVGGGAFFHCESLSSILVDPDNAHYASENGVLFNSTKTIILVYPQGKQGPYVIPNGVETISERAFYYCENLSNVTFPDSLTSIGTYAFQACSALAEVEIPVGVEIGEGAFFSSALRRVSILEGAWTLPYAFQFCSQLDSLRLSEHVSIGHAGFSYCTALKSVVIPKTASVGNRAFEECSSLESASFLGTAPIAWDGGDPGSIFERTAENFEIYYLSSQLDGAPWQFTSPTWFGYPTVRIDEEVFPGASWLLRHGLPYDTDLHGDGLLMSYALDLAPNEGAHHRPRPFIDPATGTLSLSFHAASPGITYQVQTSADLKAWSTDGVALSELGEDDRRTASVQGAESQFMRLVVESR